MAVLDQGDRDTELGQAQDELAGSVEWIDDPDALTPEARFVVPSLLRKPAFALAREDSLQRCVDFEVRLGDRVAPGLFERLDLAGSVGAQDLGAFGQRGFDAAKVVVSRHAPPTPW